MPLPRVKKEKLTNYMFVRNQKTNMQSHNMMQITKHEAYDPNYVFRVWDTLTYTKRGEMATPGVGPGQATERTSWYETSSMICEFTCV